MRIQKFESFTKNPFFKSLKRAILGPEHKDFGKQVLDKVERFLKGETGQQVVLTFPPSKYNLPEYGDFKMSIGLKIEGEDFLIEVIKKPNWALVINGVEYDVSSWTCRDLWYLLEEYQKKNKFKIDKISKFFK
jgi:hypothetical protein